MSKLIEVKVPDIGDFSDVPIIEVFVKAGDRVKAEDSLITLESDKATLDVPSPSDGVVQQLKINLGDKVSEGSLILLLEAGSDSEAQKTAAPSEPPAKAESAVPAPAKAAEPIPTPTSTPLPAPVRPAPSATTHASPSVRAFARELGIDLGRVPASGPKGRILIEDVKNFVKGVMAGGDTKMATGAAGGLDLLPWPKIDFNKFGPTETQPLSRIQKISAANLARNWVMIPAVTYHEDADITDLEAFRILLNKENEKAGIKITLLAFLIKACVKALQRYPTFNASLTGEGDGQTLVLKRYFNIGFAADTPAGLVVPVLKNADQKGVLEIARETSELAKQARDGKLKPADMQGACFTISSLGGIGGTYFAPIINAPEVAILGANKSAMKPVWNGQAFEPRLVLPLSLTADHRVIDGALATRFTAYIAQLLGDMRRTII